MQTLSAVKAKKKIKILEIKGGKSLLQHLTGMGLTAGININVLQNSGRGPILIEARRTKIGLGREMAKKIIVTEYTADKEENLAERNIPGIEELNCKKTKQREVILQVLKKIKGHITVEELTQKVKKVDSSIGVTTVYRTLKLFEDQGLVQAQIFSDGIIRYEKKQAHHDHLICDKCGKVIEFFNRRIEQLQEEESKRLNFGITRHKLEIYGICNNCKSKKI